MEREINLSSSLSINEVDSEHHILIGHSHSHFSKLRGNDRSYKKGMGLKAFFRNNWMKRYQNIGKK